VKSEAKWTAFYGCLCRMYQTSRQVHDSVRICCNGVCVFTVVSLGFTWWII